MNRLTKTTLAVLGIAAAVVGERVLRLPDSQMQRVTRTREERKKQRETLEQQMAQYKHQFASPERLSSNKCLPSILMDPNYIVLEKEHQRLLDAERLSPLAPLSPKGPKDEGRGERGRG